MAMLKGLKYHVVFLKGIVMLSMIDQIDERLGIYKMKGLYVIWQTNFASVMIARQPILKP